MCLRSRWLIWSILWFGLLFLGCCLVGCARLQVAEAPVCHLVPLDQGSSLSPDFPVIADRQALQLALRHSLDFLAGQAPERSISVCGQRMTIARLLDSVREFQRVLARTAPEELAVVVAERFELCQALNSRGEEDLLVTGYYQPRFRASLTRQAPYLYPLYGRPPDLITAEVHGEQVTKVVGRLEAGRLVPYWTRAEIEDKQPLAGQELLYLASPLDVFAVQVQGSGLVELADGMVWQVSYAGANGRPYTSIGRLMVEEGLFSLQEIDMPKIKGYLTAHPERVRSILQQNERYVFFRLAAWDAAQGPVGSMGKPLTPGYSVALDPDCFPMGGVYFLQTGRLPPAGSNGGRPGLEQFVLHQDSGAAIKGSGRLDYFWGSGPAAENAAGTMKEFGRLYLLLKKGSLDIVRDQ